VLAAECLRSEESATERSDPTPPANPYLERARKRMLDVHLASRGIKDARVLAAFEKVRREAFVLPNYRSTAYEDRPLDIGSGQTISQPYMVALMTQELDVAPEHTVLEIGTGSGYQTAILAELAARVYTVERLDALSERARDKLAKLGYDNIEFAVGDGTNGWPEPRTFDRILVTAGAPGIPDPLVEQLAEGGRLCLPVGDRYQQHLIVADKREGTLKKRTTCGCIFVKLVGEHGWDTP